VLSVSVFCSLYRYGASADAVNYGGIPNLHVAVDLGHRDVTLMLLRHNAAVNRRLYQPVSRLDADLREACLTLACDYVTPIMLAALRGRTCLIRPLVRAGASTYLVSRLVQGRDTRRLTPVVCADVELMKWLHEQCSVVTSLQQIARLAVRANLRSCASDVICELPLPRSLQEFVAFADLEDV
jgi:hypothetical protein